MHKIRPELKKKKTKHLLNDCPLSFRTSRNCRMVENSLEDPVSRFSLFRGGLGAAIELLTISIPEVERCSTSGWRTRRSKTRGNIVCNGDQNHSGLCDLYHPKTGPLPYEEKNKMPTLHSRKDYSLLTSTLKWGRVTKGKDTTYDHKLYDRQWEKTEDRRHNNRIFSFQNIE